MASGRDASRAAWSCGRPCRIRPIAAGRGRARGSTVAAPALPGSGTGEPFGEVMARGVALVSDQAEAQQHHAEVVLGGRWVERAALAGGGFRAERVRRQRQHQLDICLDLASVQSAVEVAELDGAAKEQAVEIETVITGLMI